MYKNKILFSSLSIIFVLILTFVMVNPVFAAEFISDQIVTIGEDEVIDDDLFVSGEKVIINGTVNGDVFASGAEIIVNGYINGSLWTSAASIIINGVVEGSLYSGGAALNISEGGSIGRNVYFGGFSLTAEKDSWIGRGLYSGSYQVSLNGTIANDVYSGCGSFKLSGMVGGDVNVTVDQSNTPNTQQMNSWYYNNPNLPESAKVAILDPGVTISEDAEVGGEISYTYTNQDLSVDVPGDTSVTSNYSQAKQSVFSVFSTKLLNRVGEFIALVLITLVLIRFQTENTQKVIRNLNEKPLNALLWGLGLLLLFPLAVILALIISGVLVMLVWLVTLGTLGAPAFHLASILFGTSVFTFSMTLQFITKAIFSYMIGQLMITNIAPKLLEGKYSGLWIILSGVLVYELIRFIPVIGMLVGFIISIIILGAIFLTIQNKVRKPSVV